MYCANCGTQFEGSFCPNCGSPAANNQQQNNQNSFNGYDPNANQGYNPNQNQGYNPGFDNSTGNDFNNNSNNGFNNQPQKKSNNVLIAVIAVAAVIIIGLVATVIVLGGKPDSNPQADNETTVSTTEATSEFKASENANSNSNSGSSVVEPDFSYKSATCYVTADVGLILRRGPGKGYDKIYTIKYAQSVTVLGGTDSVSNFVYVDHAGTKGWVCSDYLSGSKPTKSYNTNSGVSIGDYYSVNSWTTSVKPAKGLNIRSGATTSSYSYTVLRQGTTVTVHGVSAYNDDWYYVSAYQGGRTYYGFVSGEYLY